MVGVFFTERLKNKFANFFRTQSAVLMKARRGHHKAGEKEEELKALMNSVQNAIGVRESDTVEETTKAAAKDINEMMHELAKAEETELMVEYDTIHPLDEIIEWMERFIKALTNMQNKLTFTDELAKAKGILSELQQMKNFETKTLKAQYGALLRSLENKEGNWQTMVVAINERMSASKAMWRERSETRTVAREEKEEKHTIYEALEILENAKEGDVENRKKLADHINTIIKETQKLQKDFEEMLKDFLLIINVLVHEWFEYDKESTTFFNNLNSQLVELGYPPVEKEKIRTIEQHTLKDKQAAVEIVVHVAQRMGRKVINA